MQVSAEVWTMANLTLVPCAKVVVVGPLSVGQMGESTPAIASYKRYITPLSLVQKMQIRSLFQATCWAGFVIKARPYSECKMTPSPPSFVQNPV